MNTNRKDIWKWKDEKEGGYTTKSVYNVLQHNAYVFESLWNLKAISSVTHFTWRMLLHRIPTKANVQATGVKVENSMYVLCQQQLKIANHLFISCKIVV